jgi:hypothetical protein
VINAERSYSPLRSSSSLCYVQDPQQHVRELAHLESQMKILLQNNQAVSNSSTTSSTSTTTTITRGMQTECLSFYERFFNPQTFVWPDFVTTIFTKLAEYFATM